MDAVPDTTTKQTSKKVTIASLNPAKPVNPPGKPVLSHPEPKEAVTATAANNFVEQNQRLQSLIVDKPHLSLQFRVKAQLIERRLTQRKLAQEVKLGGSSLSRWLNGLTAKMNTGHLYKVNEM